MVSDSRQKTTEQGKPARRPPRLPARLLADARLAAAWAYVARNRAGAACSTGFPPNCMVGGKSLGSFRRNGELALKKNAGSVSAGVASQILATKQVFAFQGTVEAECRVHRGKRLGPYFRVRYRADGRRRSIYLGRSAELAELVRQLLAAIRGLRREQLASRRRMRQARAALRSHKAEMARLLATRGITLKGWEFRGIRRCHSAA